jgi:hypothetical protein
MTQNIVTDDWKTKKRKKENLFLGVQAGAKNRQRVANLKKEEVQGD